MIQFYKNKSNNNKTLDFHLLYMFCDLFKLYYVLCYLSLKCTSHLIEKTITFPNNGGG